MSAQKFNSMQHVAESIRKEAPVQQPFESVPQALENNRSGTVSERGTRLVVSHGFARPRSVYSLEQAVLALSDGGPPSVDRNEEE